MYGQFFLFRTLTSDPGNDEPVRGYSDLHGQGVLSVKSKVRGCRDWDPALSLRRNGNVLEDVATLHACSGMKMSMGDVMYAWIAS